MDKRRKLSQAKHPYQCWETITASNKDAHDNRQKKLCKLALNLPLCRWLGSQMFAWCHGVPMGARQQPACHMHMTTLWLICMRSEGSDLPAFSAKTTISVLLLPVNAVCRVASFIMACVLLPSWKQEEHPISLTPVGWHGAVANACTLSWKQEEHPNSLTPVGWCGAVANACTLSWETGKAPNSLTPVGWCGAVANACMLFPM